MRILTLSVRFNIVGMLFIIFRSQQYILSLIRDDFIKFLSCAQDKVLISLAIQVSLQVLDDIDTE